MCVVASACTYIGAYTWYVFWIWLVASFSAYLKALNYLVCVSSLNVHRIFSYGWTSLSQFNYSTKLARWLSRSANKSLRMVRWLPQPLIQTEQLIVCPCHIYSPPATMHQLLDLVRITHGFIGDARTETTKSIFGVGWGVFSRYQGALFSWYWYHTLK